MTISKEHLSRALVKLAKVLPKWAPNFDDKDILSVFHAELSKFKIEDLKAYFVTLTTTSNEFPSLAKMLHALKTQSLLSHADVGEEVAFRIESAIRKFGSWNWSEAKEFIGEVGTKIVNTSGGWEQICNCEENDLTSLRRQWRETGRIFSEKFAAGNEGPPRLPAANNEHLAIVAQLADCLDIAKKDNDDKGKKPD